MNTNEFTPENSLQLISEMIRKSRKDFEKNSGTPMILWGGLVTAVSVIVWYLLWKTGNPVWNMLWFAIPVVGWPLSWLFVGRKEEKRARTFLNDAIGGVWILFGAVAVTLSVFSCFVYREALPALMQQTVFLLGFSTSLTGMMLKNHVITVVGFVVAVAGSLLSVAIEPIFSPLLLAGTSLIALLVPGVILNLKKK